MSTPQTHLPVVIAEMTLTHLDEVVAIEAASSPAPWSAALFEGEFRIDPASRSWFVAIEANNDTSQGSIVGFVGTMFAIDEAHIMNVAVDPRTRRRGIASALLQAAFRDAVSHGHDQMTLEVRASNDGARKLYEQHGFHVLGTRKRYYRDGEDALIMWHYDIAAFLATPEAQSMIPTNTTEATEQ